jgi:hypothetical protein
MSVRAYRVLIPAVTEDMPMFNLWREPKILDFIDNGDSVIHLEDGAGTIEVSVETLEALIKDLKTHPKQYLDEYQNASLSDDTYIKETVECIQGIVDDEKKRGNTHVDFVCF